MHTLRGTGGQVMRNCGQKADAGTLIVLMVPICHARPPQYCLCTWHIRTAANLIQRLKKALPSFCSLFCSSTAMRNAWAGLLREQVTRGKQPNHARQGHPRPARPQPSHVRHVTADAGAKTSCTWHKQAGHPSNLHTQEKWMVVVLSFQG